MRQFYNILVVLFAFGFSIKGFSQVNLLNAQDPADIGKKDQMQLKLFLEKFYLKIKISYQYLFLIVWHLFYPSFQNSYCL